MFNKVQLHVSFESKLPNNIFKKITEDSYSVLVDENGTKKSFFKVITLTQLNSFFLQNFFLNRTY